MYYLASFVGIGTMRTMLAPQLVAVIAAVGFANVPNRAPAADVLLPNVSPGIIPGARITSSDANAIFVPMVINKAVVIDLPGDIKDVLVSSPATVNAFVKSKRRAYLTAIAVGQANVFFFDPEGRQIGAFDVSVRSRQAPSPFLGSPEPEIAVTVYLGPTGANLPLNCTPTNCIVPSKPDTAQDSDVSVSVSTDKK
jgi:Pilus formation protein N terminal region